MVEFQESFLFAYMYFKAFNEYIWGIQCFFLFFFNCAA